MKKILIIDDDEELCAELRQIIQREGFSVEVAFDGLQGLQLIANNNYDLIILDLKLPKLNGYQVLKRIKQDARPLKILILSGRPLGTPLLQADGNYNDDEEKILEMADAIMNKPFMVKDLLNSLGRLISISEVREVEKSQ